MINKRKLSIMYQKFCPCHTAGNFSLLILALVQQTGIIITHNYTCAYIKMKCTYSVNELFCCYFAQFEAVPGQITQNYKSVNQ